MIETRHTTTATRADIWAVLSDGWLYAGWVVGASRIRDVDAAWPSPGSKIHHSVGSWPVLLDDETQVVESVPRQKIVLTARARPFGQARVVIELLDAGDQVVIVMREDVLSGPGKALPAGLRQRALVPRNRESLRRLAYIAEGKPQ